MRTVDEVFRSYCEEVGYDMNEPYVYAWMAKEILTWKQTGVLDVGGASFVQQFALRLREAGYPWNSCLPIVEAHVSEYALQQLLQKLD